MFFSLRGQPFDSEGGGGGGWHFLEINILFLKKLKIKNMSSSERKINNLSFTFLELGKSANFSKNKSARFARNGLILK